MIELEWTFSHSYSDFQLDTEESIRFDRLALFGPSGSGKTTILNFLTGHSIPDQGRFTLQDRVLLDTKQGTRIPTEKRSIGYVMQQAPLFPHLSVQDNLEFTNSVHVDESYGKKILSLLAIEDLLPRMPGQLSGGEARRVSLAQVLFSQPQLLLLDEPLTGLDQPLREKILPRLRNLLDEIGVPAIIVSHRMDLVRALCETVLPIQNGETTGIFDIENFAQSNQFRKNTLLDDTNHFRASITEKKDSLQVAETKSGLQFLLSDMPVLKNGQPVVVSFSSNEPVLGIDVKGSISPRNRWVGTVTQLETDLETCLVSVRIHEENLWARVTEKTVEELELKEGTELEVLLKTKSLRVTPA